MKSIQHSLIRLTAVLLCAVTLWGCQAPDGGSETTTTLGEPMPNIPAQPSERESMAKSMVENLYHWYQEKGGSGDSAYINLHEYHNSTQSGYLWSNFSGVGLQYYVCKLYPDSAKEKEIFRRMINNFQYFRQSDPSANQAENSVKYHSARGGRLNGGSGDCFFDDNVWVARNYLRAYEILGDEWFLEEAIRVNNWVLSGWNHELGGIVWSEVGLTDSANAQHLERGLSANACAIIVNAKLSELVKDPAQKTFHKEWAERFYTFCKRMQNTPSTYDYWNGIHTIIENGVRKDGEINRVHFAYNSGSMILANLALYECEEDAAQKKVYMTDAVNTAKAAQKTFWATDIAAKKSYYQGDPWFAAILAEAYYELNAYKPDVVKRYLRDFAVNAELAYSNRDKRTGLCPYQATQTVTWDKNESYVIHQIGVVQQAVIGALWEKQLG